MEALPEAKSARLLTIYSRLVNGEALSKAELAAAYHVSERSIQRDMDSLRCFLANEDIRQEIVFDYQLRKYRLLEQHQHGLSAGELLAVCKILLESRSMRKDEMMPILEKLMDSASPSEDRQAVNHLLSNECYHYTAPQHQKTILPNLWTLAQSVQRQQVTEIEYERMKEPSLVHRRVQPVGIMFSEYYFYLTAFLEDKSKFDDPDDLFPTIYRIDRIRSVRVLEEHFQVPYRDRFEEGEFRKRVQFMYGGKLQRIRFRYTGPSVEAVLDRLPTARIVDQDESGWTITAEVFGKGIEMWLRSQGDYVDCIEGL